MYQQKCQRALSYCLRDGRMGFLLQIERQELCPSSRVTSWDPAGRRPSASWQQVFSIRWITQNTLAAFRAVQREHRSSFLFIIPGSFHQEMTLDDDTDTTAASGQAAQNGLRHLHHEAAQRNHHSRYL